MLKSTLLVAAMMVAVGSTTAHAGSAGGYGGKGHDRGRYGGYEHNYRPSPYAGRYRRNRGHYGGRQKTSMALVGSTIAAAPTATLRRAKSQSGSGTAAEIPTANGFGRT